MTTRRLGYFFVTIGLASIGQGLVLSYLMVYLHDALHIPLTTVGLFLVAAGVTGLLASSLAGATIDRIGALGALKAGIVLQSVGAVALALISNRVTALLAVSISGIGPAIFWPSQFALLSGLVSPTNRTKSFALQLTVLNAGIGLGGIISGSLIHLYDQSSYVKVYLADALILMISVVVLNVAFKRWQVQNRDKQKISPLDSPKKITHSQKRSSYMLVMSNKAFRRYVVIHFGFVFFGFAQLESGWSAYATQFGGATPRVVGFAFAVDTAVIVFVQLPVSRMVDRVKRSKALAIAGAIWAVSWILGAVAGSSRVRGLPSDAFLLLSMAVFGLAETVFSPVASMLVNDLAEESLRGRYNAITSAMWPLAGLVSPPLGALLLSTGISWAWITPLILGSATTAVLASRLSKVLPADVEAARVIPLT